MAAWLAVWQAVAGAASPGTKPGAVELEGFSVPREIALDDDTRLALHGTAVLRVGLVFKGYAAALFLPHGAPGARVLDDVPKRLNIYYLHNTPSARMIDTARRTMAENLPADEWEAVRGRAEALFARQRDMPKGAVGSIVYRPGRGTEFAVDGKPFAVVEGADFAAAYFGVWFAAKPSSRGVKSQLLTPIP